MRLPSIFPYLGRQNLTLETLPFRLMGKSFMSRFLLREIEQTDFPAILATSYISRHPSFKRDSSDSILFELKNADQASFTLATSTDCFVFFRIGLLLFVCLNKNHTQILDSKITSVFWSWRNQHQNA